MVVWCRGRVEEWDDDPPQPRIEREQVDAAVLAAEHEAVFARDGEALDYP